MFHFDDSFIQYTGPHLPAGVSVAANTKLAFLGLGQMGAPIARLLLQRGHKVTLWNRDRSKADAVKSCDARIALAPQEAVSDAAVVFTMLTDDAATEAVLFGNANSGGGFGGGFL